MKIVNIHWWLSSLVKSWYLNHDLICTKQLLFLSSFPKHDSRFSPHSSRSTSQCFCSFLAGSAVCRPLTCSFFDMSNITSISAALFTWWHWQPRPTWCWLDTYTIYNMYIYIHNNYHIDSISIYEIAYMYIYTSPVVYMISSLESIWEGIPWARGVSHGFSCILLEWMYRLDSIGSWKLWSGYHWIFNTYIYILYILYIYTYHIYIYSIYILYISTYT